mmetsp:Transcript_10003/g.26551  ORF Transcript_10003/g.26551 Transcript_10003/m.26551 type:complete len:510 (+) Transcript_10003:67-1596(+)
MAIPMLSWANANFSPFNTDRVSRGKLSFGHEPPVAEIDVATHATAAPQAATPSARKSRGQDRSWAAEAAVWVRSHRRKIQEEVKLELARGFGFAAIPVRMDHGLRQLLMELGLAKYIGSFEGQGIVTVCELRKVPTGELRRTGMLLGHVKLLQQRLVGQSLRTPVPPPGVADIASDVPPPPPPEPQQATVEQPPSPPPPPEEPAPAHSTQRAEPEIPPPPPSDPNVGTVAHAAALPLGAAASLLCAEGLTTSSQLPVKSLDVDGRARGPAASTDVEEVLEVAAAAALMAAGAAAAAAANRGSLTQKNAKKVLHSAAGTAETTARPVSATVNERDSSRPHFGKGSTKQRCTYLPGRSRSRSHKQEAGGKEEHQSSSPRQRRSRSRQRRGRRRRSSSSHDSGSLARLGSSRKGGWDSRAPKKEIERGTQMPLQTAMARVPGASFASSSAMVAQSQDTALRAAQIKAAQRLAGVPCNFTPLRNGDWLCPMCNAHNYKSKQKCFRCFVGLKPI